MPDSWIEVPLQQIADVIDPHPSHRAPDEVRDGVPFAGIGDFNSRGDIVNSSVRRVSPKTLKEHSYRYRISANTIGFGRVASIGKVVDFSADADGIAISPTMAVIEPKSIDKKFLVSALQGNIFLGRIGRLLTGTTRSSLGIELLRKLKVPIPSNSNVAEKIGRIFSTVDEAIEQTEALIAKTQQIKVGLMHDLFTRGVTPDGQLRPPHEEAPQLYKESPLGWIPKEWQLVDTDEKLEVVDPQPDHRTPPEVLDGYPYIGIGDIFPDGTLNFAAARKVASAAFQKQRHSFDIFPGAFIFGKIGTIGQPTPIPHERNYALSANVVLLTSESALNSVFGYWLFSSAYIVKQVLDATNTTSQPALGIQKIRKFRLPWPGNDAEIEQISAILDAVTIRSKREIAKCEKLRKAKSGLMADLLSGCVSVPAKPDDIVLEKAVNG